MTQLELFRATMAHEPHGEFLYYASFITDLDRRIREKYGLSPEVSLVKHFGMYERVGISPRSTVEYKPDFSVYFRDVEKPEGSFINGLGVLEIPAKFYHFTGYVSPLRHAARFEEIEAFPFMPSTGFDETGLKEQVAEAHAQGLAVYSYIGHMYEDAWQIRGYEEFLMDMAERPDWCEYILDRITERNVALATAAARAGADWILSGDDVANQNALMFSLPMWRRFMKTRWAKVYAAARAIKPDIHIWYHSDGNIGQIIPELIEIGLTILNPVQPECLDVLQVKKQFGKALVLDGSIGTQTTMPFGTPAEVKRVVRERKKTLGYDGGLILSPTHVLEPEVPVENIEAFVEACREQT